MNSTDKSVDTRYSVTFDQGTLLLQCPSTQHHSQRDHLAEQFGDGVWTWDDRVAAWRCEAFHYRNVITTLWRQKLPYLDEASQWEHIEWPGVEIHSPRPEQAKAIQQWMEDKRGVVVMPTGTGKTEVALHLLAKTQCSTLIVSPVRDLMYQWHRRIKLGLRYDAGIIGDNTFNVRPVSVTTYDSAAIHAAKLGDRFKLVVFDECHHLPGNFRRDAATMSIAPWRLGLTATLIRSDGKHADLESLIGPVVYELKIAAVKGKALADFDVIKIPVHLSAEEQFRYDTDSLKVKTFVRERLQTDAGFRWEDLCSESARDPIARDVLVAFRSKQAIEDRAEEKLRVLEDLFRLHAGTPIIVFAGSNAMARDVSIRFLIPSMLNHCGKKERFEILQGLADGTYPAIVANQVLDEGVDVPTVKVAIVIGGSSSTRQAKQRLGRVLRKSGNSRAILYEVVCMDTGEEKRSRKRRKSDAYERTRHRRV
ncbi:MAG: DEAD/DEAH box helicase family protein [Pirellulaceae bacterium]